MDVSKLSDDQLRNELTKLDQVVGPIVGTTRRIYELKLMKLKGLSETSSDGELSSEPEVSNQKPLGQHRPITPPETQRYITPIKNADSLAFYRLDPDEPVDSAEPDIHFRHHVTPRLATPRDIYNDKPPSLARTLSAPFTPSTDTNGKSIWYWVAMLILVATVCVFGYMLMSEVMKMDGVKELWKDISKNVK